MIKTTTIFSVVAALLSAHTAFAQSDVSHMPGYVVKSPGDTVRGWLNVPRFVTDNGLKFAASREAPAQPLRVEDVRAFGLADGRRYVRATIADGKNAATGPVDSATIFLQQLVAGAASLYRYDYNAPRHGGSSAQSETVRYYARVPRSPLVPLRAGSHQGVLAALLNDCAAVVKDAQRVPFRQDALAELMLHYNAQCYPALGYRDQRPQADPTNPAQLRLGLRGGLQRSLLYYIESREFEREYASAGTSPVVGAELRWGRLKSPWSLALGLVYAPQRGSARYTATALPGTTNAGQVLEVGPSLRLNTLQLPYLFYYTVGRGALQPYVAAGGTVVANWGMEYTGRATTLTLIGPNQSRQDVVVTTTSLTGTRLSFGGLARAGVRLPVFGRLAPLVEAQFGFGQHNQASTKLKFGNPTYQIWGLSVGVELR